MKKSKKLIAILLCAMLVLGFSGCGGDDEDTLSQVQKDGQVIMGTNAEFPPFEYRDENGDVAGFDVEIAKEIAAGLGVELVIEDMDFGSIISALQSGKIDFGLAGMSVTEDRLANADFSDAYFNASQVIIVKADNDMIKGNADLVGKTIGVQEGTTGDLEASEVEGATVMRFKKGVDAVMDLQNGKLDAVVIDALPAAVFAEKNDDIVVLDEYFTEEEYAIAIRKGDDAFLNEVNRIIAELKDSGRYQEIYDEYIGD
ncbi:basic amino acid ABC transporter substrate-binding protein [Clostridia bacterium]|nr:basic amino acid ABC transporter substrate-binding protein [Clostridia bacterium]